MNFIHSRLTYIVLAGISAALFVGLTSLFYVGYEPLYFLNQSVYLSIIESSFSKQTVFWRIVTTFGGISFLAISTVSMAIFLKKYRKDSVDAYMYILSMIFGLAVVAMIKMLTAIDRPEYVYAIEETFSFPSGHTALSVIFFVVSAYVYVANKSHSHKRLVCLAVLILLLLIGFSRLALGEHWILDVVGGYLLGLAVATSAILIFHKKVTLQSNS